LREAVEPLHTLRTPEGVQLPENTLAELRHDMDRLGLVKQQIKEVEAARLEQFLQAPGEKRNAKVHQLPRVVGIGLVTAEMPAQEVFSTICVIAERLHDMRV
jgi:transposase